MRSKLPSSFLRLEKESEKGGEWPIQQHVLSYKKSQEPQCGMGGNIYLLLAGPSTDVTRLVTPNFLKASLDTAIILGLSSSVMISACVSLVPSYHAMALYR